MNRRLAVSDPSSLLPVAASDGRVLLDASELKRLRKLRGLSQDELARQCFDRRLCVSIASIKRAETGKPVLYRTARHLAEVYEVDVNRLLGQGGAPAPAAEAIGAVAKPQGQTQTPWRPALSTQRSVVHLLLAWSKQVLVTAECPLVVQDQVQAFGGQVVASSEVGVVVAFGHEQAHRSDAARALACAQALVQGPLSLARSRQPCGPPSTTSAGRRWAWPRVTHAS
jgi:transcriptional regulator with XRE-family HTH domain